METDNILADQMQVSRPVFVIQIAMMTVRIIAETRCIVAQSVNPYIDHMLIIKINRNTPFEGCS